MKRLLIAILFTISAMFAAENIMPNSDFSRKNAQGRPEEWEIRPADANVTIKDGALTIQKDGKSAGAICRLQKNVKADTTYVFTHTCSSPEETTVRIYIESTCRSAAGKTYYKNVGTAPFKVGTKPMERKLTYTIPSESVSTYIACFSEAGKPLTISNLVFRPQKSKPFPAGGFWSNIEDHVAFIDNGVVATMGKPAILSGVPVEPGKTYMLSYNAQGEGSTGTEYPFHEIVVRAEPTTISGFYFFDDARNEEVQPKRQKITIPADSGIKTVKFTFNANTKGRVKFFDFEFKEYIQDQRDAWKLLLDEPYYRDIIFASTDSGRVAGTIEAAITNTGRDGLATPAKATVGIAGVGEVTVALTGGKGSFSIPAKNLADGKYELVCRIFDANSNEQKVLTRKLVKVPKGKNEVICRKNGYFYCDGKPFFPVGLWNMTINKEDVEASFHQVARNGVNLSRINFTDDIKAQLETLDMYARHGMKAFISCDYCKNTSEQERQAYRRKLEKWFPPEVRNHTAFMGYFIVDEPLWGGKPYNALQMTQEVLKEFDPYHPSWINAAPRNEVENLIPYGEACDIYGVDIYPIPTPNTHSGLDDKGITSVGKYASRMNDVVFWRKPIWMALQGFSWGAYVNAPDLSKHIYPNDAETRFMAYDSQLNGGRGYLLWGTNYVKSEEFFKIMFKMMRELQSVSGLFVNCEQLADVANAGAGVRVVPLKTADAVYYAIMNLTEKDAACAFAPASGAAPLNVYADGRRIVPAQGKVAISLKPLEVIICGAAPLPSPTYKLEEPDAKLMAFKNGDPVGAIARERYYVLMNTVPYEGAASWIWSKDSFEANGCTLVATNFNVDDPANGVLIKVAIDDKGEVYLNGKLLGELSSYNLMRMYDASKTARKGKNTLIIRGMDAGGMPCGILAEIQVAGKLLKNSGADWLAKPFKPELDLPASLDGFTAPLVVAPYGGGAWAKKVRVFKKPEP